MPRPICSCRRDRSIARKTSGPLCVAVHSTWSGDFYGILQGGTGENQITLSLIENPLLRWLWLGGGMAVAAALAWRG